MKYDERNVHSVLLRSALLMCYTEYGNSTLLTYSYLTLIFLQTSGHL